jgi:thiosulfate/3-mercaptopyruvate sulfurtransferase
VSFGPLVDPRWLCGHLGEPDLTVVDCRWHLGEPGAGEREYEAGHVPWAAFMDTESDLSAPPGPGRHPLPEPASFARAARESAIGRASRVVAYDDSGEGGAVRLWWLLRHFGHDAAAVLDGGLRAWREAEYPLRAGRERCEAGDFEARPRTGDTVAGEELRGRLGDPRLALLDARAPERYRGETEPLDPVAGHIPGARTAPFAELAPGGRFLERPQLRTRLERAGAAPGRDLVAYCGSGVTACTVVLAAELAGFQGVRLYPGSWSEWSRLGLPATRKG